jgi:hypothetical protein
VAPFRKSAKYVPYLALYVIAETVAAQPETMAEVFHAAAPHLTAKAVKWLGSKDENFYYAADRFFERTLPVMTEEMRAQAQELIVTKLDCLSARQRTRLEGFMQRSIPSAMQH